MLNGVDLADPSAPVPPVVGSIQLHDRLGQSRSGVVLDATIADGTRVAMKLARPPLEAAERREETARLLRELSVLKALHHPGVIRLVDAGLVGGLLYMAVERVEGVTLRTLLGDAECDFDTVAAVGVYVGNTLGHLHEVGVLQRELTPDVIVVDREGRAALADFGFSTFIGAPAITEPGPPRGTLSYMAPELFDTGKPSPLSDQYALGRLLFELCVPSARSSIRADQATPAERQSVGYVDWSSFPTGAYLRSLKPVLERMLAVEPTHRYPDVHAAVAEIGQLAALKGAVSSLGGRGQPMARSTSGADAFAVFVDHVSRFQDDGSDEELRRSLSDSFSDVGAPFYATSYILMEPKSWDREEMLAAVRRQAEAFFVAADQLRDDARTFWEGRARDAGWTAEHTALDDPDASTAPGSDTIFDALPSELMSNETSVTTDEGHQTIREEGFNSDDAATMPGVPSDERVEIFPEAAQSKPPGFLPVPSSSTGSVVPGDPLEHALEKMHADTVTDGDALPDPADDGRFRAPSVYAVPSVEASAEPPRKRRLDLAVTLAAVALVVLGVAVGYLIGSL